MTVKSSAKKTTAKDSAKATSKAKVSVKADAKKRRLQANKPADKPAEKPATNDDTDIEVTKDGLPVSEYKDEFEVPTHYQGFAEQKKPKTANLVKLCFMLFAALLTMY